MTTRMTRLKQMVEAEKKKAFALAALVAALGVIAGRHMLSAGPRKSQAALGADVSSAQSPVDAGQAAIGRTIASLTASKLRFIEIRSSPTLTRDLFALNTEHFPVPSQTEAESSATEQSGTPGVESAPPSADEQRRAREALLVSETQGWRVRSVLLGSNESAVIETPGADGRRHVLRVGQFCRGWSVIEIESTHVIIEKEGVRVRLSAVSPDR